MKKIIFISLLCSIFFYKNIYSQQGFKFSNPKKKKQTLSFKLINNLIIIPLEINGKELNFILDTGVNKTILFNLSATDSLGLKDVEKVALQGLGTGDSVDALLSRNNKFKIKGLSSNKETIYVIIKDYFDLSSRMGITIHGIIGYNLLKNLIVEVNYNTKKIRFHNPKLFKYKKCKKCETFPLKIRRRKPFVEVKIQLDTIGSELTDVKMLIDTGGSDAIWLFEDSKDNIKTPHKFFNDLLGEGLSGPIYGNRSRIPKIVLNRFIIEKPTVSFLDTISTKNARNFKERNGSIGGGILRRFKLWIDYPNSKITLKKNGSFKNGFNYNMSGLDVVYAGKQLIKEQVYESFTDAFNQEVSQSNSVSFVTKYSFKFKPTFKVKNVVKGSPGDRAGILKDDIILSINGKKTHNFLLKDIIYKFQEKDGKKVKLLIERNGKKKRVEFYLEKRV